MDDHVAQAPAVLERTFVLAGIEPGAAQAAANKLLSAVAENLRAQINEFEEGWTSPVPKRWNERFPVTYALLLLVAGSA
ncbi:hypothetical protein NL453_27835, partial [Klebsiella pneumoniae]|nr:hypothetical protein [Klebsiella pneumoniae]